MQTNGWIARFKDCIAKWIEKVLPPLYDSPTPLKTTISRFVSVGPPFFLIGVLVACISAAGLGALSQSAIQAVQEMLALNALVLVVIAAMFLSGLVSTIIGSPKKSWGPWRKAIFHLFSARPAEFVTDFSAPMFWFFTGVGLVMLFASALTLGQAGIFVLFLASLVLLGNV